MSPKSRIAIEFGERLRVLAKAVGGQKALAERLGWSQAQVSQYCRGYNAPGLEVLQKIQKKTSCNWGYLVGELATPFASETPGKRAEGIDTYVAGGGADWTVNQHQEPYQTAVPSNMTGYELQSDSMEPLAHQGQVVIAMSNVDAQDGELALVQFHDGRHTFKRIYHERDQVILVPVNPHHKPEVRSAHEMRYAWKVWGIKF